MTSDIPGAVLDLGATGAGGDWPHIFGEDISKDWYYNGAPMGSFSGDSGQFALSRYDIFPGYENDPFWWLDTPAILTPFEMTFKMKFAGGPAPRSFTPFETIQVALVLTEADTKSGLSAIGNWMFVYFYTGNGGSGLSAEPDEDGLYGYADAFASYDSADYVEFNGTTGPMFSPIWDKVLDVRATLSDDGTTFDVYVSNGGVERHIQTVFHTSAPPIGGQTQPPIRVLNKINTVGFTSVGLSANVTGNPTVTVDITDISFTAKAGLIDRFTTQTGAVGSWGTAEISGEETYGSEPKADLWSVTEFSEGRRPEYDSTDGHVGSARADYLIGGLPPGSADPLMAYPLGLDLMALVDADPRGYVDIFIRMYVECHDPDPENDVFFYWYLAKSLGYSEAFGTPEFDVGPSPWLSAQLRNTVTTHLLLTVDGTPSFSYYGGEAAQVGTDARMGESTWLLLRLSRTMFQGRAYREDFTDTHFDPGFGASTVVFASPLPNDFQPDTLYLQLQVGGPNGQYFTVEVDEIAIASQALGDYDSGDALGSSFIVGGVTQGSVSA